MVATDVRCRKLVQCFIQLFQTRTCQKGARHLDEQATLRRAGPVTTEPYEFANSAEAEATYFVLAWFAVTESAALGIFPLLSALNQAHETDPTYFPTFFQEGFQHFRDEQRHANLWCRALLDFTVTYPDVIKQTRLPQGYLKIMLKSIGQPHSVLNFGIDCLAFELIMQALYDVIAPRLHYPPLVPIFETIVRDEIDHTAFDHHYVGNHTTKLSPFKKFRAGLRFWRNTLGVLITVGPLLDLLDLWQPLPRRAFYQRLAHYQRQAGIFGGDIGPNLLARLK